MGENTPAGMNKPMIVRGLGVRDKESEKRLLL